MGADLQAMAATTQAASASSDPLLQAPWFVQAHLGLALLAVIVGTIVLLRAKGTTSHRWLGRIWVLAMLVLTLLSFGIRTHGQFSWIHLLSIVTLVSVPLGWYRARTGRIGAHRMAMCATFAGLAVAGVFTLLPHRILGQLVFGG